jgi:glycosyltransferase involved in cell wall biosynthesis
MYKIFVVSGYGYWGDFLPTDLDEGEKQIGGGETAMIQISRALSNLGHDVTVFYDVARSDRYDGVNYLPSNLFVPLATQMRHDVLVSWDNSAAFRFADKARLRILAFQLNDTFIGPYDYTVDMYMHPSKWHAERYHELYPEMDGRKSRPRITNGIDPARYNPEDPPERNSHQVIYSSSPDRGLHHLLRFWPRIREAVPDATLEVFYEIDNWLTMVDNAPAPPGNIKERAQIIREFRTSNNGSEESGVTFHGGVGQGRLSVEQMKSAVQAYPCDPVQPTEGFSMTCLEAITAGCDLIVTDADALKELWADAPCVTVLPLPINDDIWVDTIVKALQKEEPRPLRDPVQYYWSTIATNWQKEIAACLMTPS